MNSVNDVKPQGQGRANGISRLTRRMSEASRKEQSAKLAASGSASHLSGEALVPGWWCGFGGLHQVQGQHSLTHKLGGHQRREAPMSLPSRASSFPLRAGGYMGVRRGFFWGRSNHSAPKGVCSPTNLVTAHPPPHPTQDPPPPAFCSPGLQITPEPSPIRPSV